MDPLVILFLAALAVGGYFAYKQVKARQNGKKPTHGPVAIPPVDIPRRPAGETIPINAPPAPPTPPAPPQAGGNGAPNIVGDPVLARTVDVSASRFLILGPLKHFAPGDNVKFFVQALSMLEPDGTRAPVPGLPVIVKNKAQQRLMTGPVLTDEQGVAVLAYVVTDADQLDGDDPNVPDGGSYLLNAYIGGRLLNTVVPLPDAI